MKTEEARTNRARRLLGVGAIGLLVGIGLSAVGQGPFGGWIAVASAGSMIFGIHTFGRLGPDAPEPLPNQKQSDKKPRKKRKKKPKDQPTVEPKEDSNESNESKVEPKDEQKDES